MKYGKDEIQKMFLGLLLLVGLLYYYFIMLLGPLNHEEETARNNIAELTPKVKAAQDSIRNAKTLKAKADEADAKLEQIKGMIPDGSPVAWFPPLINEFFSRQGIEKCAVHHGDEGGDAGLIGFRKATWGLEIVHVEVMQLGLAVAAFENEHPLMQIDSLQINASRENVQYQTARMGVTTIIK